MAEPQSTAFRWMFFRVHYKDLILLIVVHVQLNINGCYMQTAKGKIWYKTFQKDENIGQKRLHILWVK